jgi:hypothetical protein
MTVMSAIFFPIVLVYQAWSYRVFRRRLSVPKIDDEDTGSAAAQAASAGRGGPSTSTPADST